MRRIGGAWARGARAARLDAMTSVPSPAPPVLAGVLETAAVDESVRVQDDLFRHVNGRFGYYKCEFYFSINLNKKILRNRPNPDRLPCA